MELPPGLKPTLVNLDELNTVGEDMNVDGDKIDYRERYIESLKDLSEKDNFDPKSTASIGTGSSSTEQEAATEIPGNNIGKGIILVIILVIVIWIIYYVIKRHRKAQSELKEKMDAGDETSSYYNKIRSSDLGRNVFTGAEIVLYLGLLFGIVTMIGKVTRASKSVLKD
jgi:hypothetical protein